MTATAVEGRPISLHLMIVRFALFAPLALAAFFKYFFPPVWHIPLSPTIISLSIEILTVHTHTNALRATRGPTSISSFALRSYKQRPGACAPM